MQQKKCLEFYFSRLIESVKLNFLVKTLNESFAQNQFLYSAKAKVCKLSYVLTQVYLTNFFKKIVL